LVTRRIPIAILAVVLGLALTAAAAVAAVAVAAHPAARTVVAIGDSIMDGHGLTERQSWPEVVARDHGWRLTDLAADGDGFVTAGDDGTTFADQVRQAIRLNPSTVILAGSSNDLGVPETTVEAAIRSAVAQLRSALPSAQIVAVSPVWNEDAWPAQLQRIAAAVRTDVRAVGGSVLTFADPLRGHPELMQADDVHPTAAGQLMIAASVEQRWDAAALG
jgi:acyl-CoA thioesterase I